jgi:hypothetical protein
MQNTHENDAREGRANEMNTLRELYLSIIDWDQNGANINDEIGHFLAGLSVADPNSVCLVANFVVDGRRQVNDEADSTGETTLMPTWDIARTPHPVARAPRLREERHSRASTGRGITNAESTARCAIAE